MRAPLLLASLLALSACASSPPLTPAQRHWAWRPDSAQGHDVGCRLMDVTYENADNARECGLLKPDIPGDYAWARGYYHHCGIEGDLEHLEPQRCDTVRLCVDHTGAVVDESKCYLAGIL